MILVRDLRLLCRVGVPASERAVAQPIRVDLDLDVDLDAAAGSDDVADTVDYGAVVDAVASALTEGDHALLETLAGLAADAALAVDPATRSVTVTVTKLRPPIAQDVASTGVRLRRARS